MDPQATLFDILDAIKRNDRQQVSELLEALSSWIERGGFLPDLRVANGPCGTEFQVGRKF